MPAFPAARWSGMLRAASLLGAGILVAVGVAAAMAIPRGTRVPFAETFGMLVAVVPPAIVVAAVLTVVRGYDVDRNGLRVRRLLWWTTVPLAGLVRVAADPTLVRGSVRVFGNGGLFAFTGRYRNRTLGPYRAFVTDWTRAVVLELPGRAVVVSPADPAAFVRAVAARFPAVAVSA
ncbi:MAG: PH domain-containing protein [Burkholderiales bacterium]